MKTQKVPDVVILYDMGYLPMYNGSFFDCVEHLIALRRQGVDAWFHVIKPFFDHEEYAKIVMDRYVGIKINDTIDHTIVSELRQDVIFDYTSTRWKTIIVPDGRSYARLRSRLNAEKRIVLAGLPPTSAKEGEKFLNEFEFLGTQNWRMGLLLENLNGGSRRSTCLLHLANKGDVKIDELERHVRPIVGDDKCFVVDHDPDRLRPQEWFEVIEPCPNVLSKFDHYIHYKTSGWFDPSPRMPVECMHLGKRTTYINETSVIDGSSYRSRLGADSDRTMDARYVEELLK